MEPIHYRSLKTGQTFPFKEWNKEGMKRPLPDDAYPITIDYPENPSVEKPLSLNECAQQMLDWFIDIIPEQELVSIRSRVMLNIQNWENDPVNKEFDRRMANATAKWLLNPITALCTANGIDITELPIPTNHLRDLITYVEFTDLIDFSVAVQKILPAMYAEPNTHPWEIMERLGLLEERNENELTEIVTAVLDEYAAKVMEYKGGKTGLFSLFMGQVMKKTKGKYPAQQVNDTVTNELSKR